MNILYIIFNINLTVGKENKFELTVRLPDFMELDFSIRNIFKIYPRNIEVLFQYYFLHFRNG